MACTVFLECIDVALQALDPQVLAIKLLQELLILSLIIAAHKLLLMLGCPFVLYDFLEILVLRLFHLTLLSQGTCFNLEIIDLLSHELFILFELCTGPLQSFFIVFVIH